MIPWKSLGIDIISSHAMGCMTWDLSGESNSYMIWVARAWQISCRAIPEYDKKRLHSGAKTAPLLEKWYHFQPFFFFLENSGKWLHRGTVLANGTTWVRGTFFSQTWLLRKKFSKTAPGRSHFGSTFFSVYWIYHVSNEESMCVSNKWQFEISEIYLVLLHNEQTCSQPVIQSPAGAKSRKML